MSKFIGDVSAYAYAVSKGYTGTEEEFAELMASYADVGQTAVDAKDAAVAAKTAAQTAATTATNKASEATTAAQTATTKAGEASQSASQAQTSAQTASTKASEASQSASTASTKAGEATTAAETANTAKTDAVSAKNAAETAQGKAETAQGAAEDAAESVSASAAQIATNTSDISDLKENFIESNGLQKASTVITQGITISTDGEENVANDYESTDYISVSTGDLYLVTNSTGGYPDANDQRSNLTGVAGYDSSKAFVTLLQNQLMGNGTQGGRHISKNYIVKIPDGISYIRATSAYKSSIPSYEVSPLLLYKIVKNGFNGIDYKADDYTPVLANGTVPNPANTYAVCTDFVPCFEGAMVSCIVNKPYRASTNYYTYGYVTYTKDKEIVRNNNYNGLAYGQSSIRIQNGEAYIRFNVCEYNSSASAVANRITDYVNYPIRVIVRGEQAVLDAVESIEETLNKEKIEITAISGSGIGFYDGSVITSDDYDCTDYIAVKPNETYMVSCSLGGNYDTANPLGLACYNSSKTYICGLVSQMSAIGVSGGRHAINDYVFMIPDGAYYIRACSAARNTSGNSSYAAMPISLYKILPDSTWGKLNLVNDINKLNAEKTPDIIASSRFNSFASGYREYYTTAKKNLTFAIISDLHGGYNQFDRFAQYVNANENYIDMALCLGDIVLSEPKEGLFTYENTINKFNVPFGYVVGNHDMADTYLSGITQAQARTKYYAPIISAELMSASDFGSDSGCYWHKDFADYKVRVIALFEYGNATTLSTGAPGDACRRWIDSSQLQWFADTLYNTPSDYSVLLLTHQIPYYPMTYVDGLFTQTDPQMTSATFLNTVDGRCIGDIVDAYINGTNLSRTYNSIASYGLSKTATVSKDFSQRGEGKYICNLCGHVHADYVLTDTEYSNQITIALPSGSSSPYQQKYNDTPVSADGKNMDRFSVVSVDTEHKRINIVRIGAEDTIYMETRNKISISY